MQIKSPRGIFQARILHTSACVLALSCGVKDYPHEETDQPITASTVKPQLGGGGNSAALSSSPPPAVSSAPPVPSQALPATAAPSAAPSLPPSAAPSTVPVPSTMGMASTAPMPTMPPPTPTVAPPSGATLDLNGTIVAKEDVLAFIHIGHSNMAGRASRPSSERDYFFTEIDAAAWMYKGGAWSPALEPNTAGDSGNRLGGQTLGGPGTALVKQAAALAQDKFVISLGYGVASAYCTQFLPGALYYDQLIESALELKGKVTFAAIVIMLGITERHGTDADIQKYPECINQLTTAIRTDVGEPNLPMLITDYEMGSTGEELKPDGEYGTKIRPLITQIPSVVSNSALVPTEDLGMQDDHHFDLAGQKEWSRRALQIMRDKGWAPWAK
jgi:Carbohydrate esterase, sialic acid-specific acetylesterase